jgi:carbohydrate-selective porin OprB
MTVYSFHQPRAVTGAAACLALLCTQATVLAQDVPPPPATAPPAEAQAPASTAQPAGTMYTGSPRQASVGGAEPKIGDEPAGLFPVGPISWVEPHVKDFEKWSSDKLRLDLGFRAFFGFQQASGGPGERTAASQDYRIYGTFHAFNWEEEKKGWAGNIYFRTEYRGEMFTKITPFQLNTQIGTLFTTTYGQDQHDLALVQLYYEQFMFDGKLRARVGKIDPDDYFNLGRFADDYRYFDNALFSAFPSANHPSGGLGFNLQWYITPDWTLTGGMSDVQGKKTHSGFDTIDDWKFFYGLDITWSPKFEGWGQGNYRAGIEYRDDVEGIGQPDDTSFYLNIDQEVAKDVAPFVRFGHGTGHSTGIDNVFSTGIGLDNPFGRKGDACGFGIGFDTADSAVPSSRDIEYAAELFYRVQVTRTMQWTVGQQLILHPINAPDDDVVGVFEMKFLVEF